MAAAHKVNDNGNHPYANAFPVPNSTTPFWRTEPHEIDEHRTTETLPEICDIVIIGSGMSGTSIAYHILSDYEATAPSMVMLEARETCSGATGRNGGHAKLAWNGITSMLKGKDVSVQEELANFHLAQIDALKAVVDKEKIDCDFSLRRSFSVFVDQTLAEEAKNLFEQWQNLGFEATKHVDLVNEKYVEQITRVQHAKAAFSTPACSFWPYKLVSSVLAICISKGLNLQTSTPVSSVSATQDSAGYHSITTSRGTIRAKKVVFATNGYTAPLLTPYANEITPWRGTCSRLALRQPPQSLAPDSRKEPNLAFTTFNITYGVGDTDYINPRPDGSIIVGGAGITYKHIPELYNGNWDDSTLIDEAIPSFENYLQRNFVDYEGTDAGIAEVWTGIMGRTPDSLPHIGAIPARKDQFIIAGFNGSGMIHIWSSGKGVAEMIMKGKTFEETNIPSIFKTTQERLDRQVLNED